MHEPCVGLPHFLQPPSSESVKRVTLWGSSTNQRLWCQKTRVPGLSRCVIGVITFIRFDTIPACDRHTERQTNTRWRLIPAHRLRRAGKSVDKFNLYVYTQSGMIHIYRNKFVLLHVKSLDDAALSQITNGGKCMPIVNLRFVPPARPMYCVPAVKYLLEGD